MSSATASAISPADVYITRTADDMVFSTGKPVESTIPVPTGPKKRVLVVGGGVTFSVGFENLPVGWVLTDPVEDSGFVGFASGGG